MAGPLTPHHWSNILATERKDKKKPFRKAFVFRDEHCPNTTTVILANTATGFTGAPAMLIAKYKAFINFVSGVAVIQTTRVSSGKDRDSTFECVAALDLDSFLAAFSDSEQFSEALFAKTQELVQEWWGDNGGKDKMSIRIPIERSYQLSKHTWRENKRQEFSVYDLTLSE